MSIRHIYAESGGHIAVPRGHQVNAGDPFDYILAIGALMLVAGGALLIYFFWPIILTCLGIASALWLIWKFRVSLWDGICWCAPKLWRVICWFAAKLWYLTCWCAPKIWHGICNTTRWMAGLVSRTIGKVQNRARQHQA